ncbi:uncharacterized protein LOC126410510 isoform X2 [Nymphaea colorata]|uniref:uncharacterized protein LOC126410510 isoform X2 n=1 Tax=Nymphaea colorata TaxID=210225 RepID=UPI00214E141F|nr:uncharacterized protein LOC126410510 isoform X2 [Nymphaea colorata]
MEQGKFTLKKSRTLQGPTFYRGFFFCLFGLCLFSRRTRWSSRRFHPGFSIFIFAVDSLRTLPLRAGELTLRRQKVLLQRAADPGSFGQISRMGVLLLLEMLLRSGQGTSSTREKNVSRV